MIKTDAIENASLRQRFRDAFGNDRDSMETVARRAERLFPDAPVIVWEGDAQTFEFSYVSANAEKVLGYPGKRWTTEPTFWADTVVHPDDRSDAIAFCALATGKCCDHDFVYRANTSAGGTVWLHDVVKVVVGERGIASRLRGIMVPIDPDEPAP